MPYDKPKPYTKPETLISVETQIGEPTVNHQHVEMKAAGRVGGANPRMLPKNTRTSPNFI